MYLSQLLLSEFSLLLFSTKTIESRTRSRDCERDREYVLVFFFIIFFLNPCILGPLYNHEYPFAIITFKSLLFLHLSPSLYKKAISFHCVYSEPFHKKMCLTSSEPPMMRSKEQTHLRIRNLTRRRRLLKEQKEMEMKNLKLFLENQSILRENEVLKRKAFILHQENNALFSLLHPKLSATFKSSS